MTELKFYHEILSSLGFSPSHTLTRGGSTYKSFRLAPPNRTKFFHFTRFCQKEPMLEVGAPSNEVGAPNGKSWIRPC